jgi:2-haloacid dehalogenase
LKTASTAFAASALHCFGDNNDFNEIKALTFDVFGTVVDWRSSIIKEGEALGKRKGIQVDWMRFTHAWAQSYGASIKRVRSGKQPWTTVSDLLKAELDKLLIKFKVSGLTTQEKEEFARVWERLDPWPDSVEGLKKLRKNFTIATLSNGEVRLLENLSAHNGIEWDRILSAEHAKCYKTDKKVYFTAARLLKLQPHQIMMVASHPNDLRAAAGCGFKTAFVMRPLEWGPGKPPMKYEPSAHSFDIVARDFHDLAKKLTGE